MNKKTQARMFLMKVSQFPSENEYIFYLQDRIAELEEQNAFLKEKIEQFKKELSHD